MKWQKHAFAATTLATRKRPSTLSMGTLRLLLSAVAFMALCFSFADMALAQTATAYSKEAMEQALATKHHYDLYGIHFDFDKAVIKPDSNALLDDIATTLKHFPEWRLRITGHTDSTGNAAYNEELSMNRANAIKQALADRGIDAARLETLGMGEKQPVASNDTPEGQALNRRGMMAGKTPNLDKIAKEGMLFTDYYAEASCTAGRANFITGELPIRTGMTTVGQAGAKIGIPAEAVTTATILKSMGYATGQFGKNHLGDLNEFLPCVHGFDEFFGYLYHLDAMEDPAHPNYPQNLLNVVGPRNMVHCWATDKNDPTDMPRWGVIGKQKIEDAGQLYPKRMETVGNEIRDLALNFMDKAKKANKPFFVWLNPTRMHIVTHLSPKYEAMRNSENGWSEEEAGMAQIDDIVGSVMQKLKDIGEDENTIVVFTTDNGTEVFTWPDGGQTPFAQCKGTVMEGGFRVPAILRWPGHVPADSVQNGIFSGLDWLPTFVSIAGNPNITQELLKGKTIGDRTYKNHLDGYDQTAAITGKGPSARHEIFYLGESTIGAVRIDDYKYRFIDQPGGWLGVKNHPDVPYLINLRLDPFERTGWPNDGTKEGAQQYFDWFKYEFWRFVFVQQLMGKEIQTFLDYPPMQRGASFNLDALKAEMSKKMAEAEAAAKGPSN